MPEISTMTDGNGRYIFINGDASKGIPATLSGYPLKYTCKTPVLGTMGDLMLVDLRYYLVKDGSGPFVAASEHVHFVNNKTVIKCFWNVDGKGWLASPLTLEDGVTKVSPFVVLDVPQV
jgi:HK97 family phage major capsid protein